MDKLKPTVGMDVVWIDILQVKRNSVTSSNLYHVLYFLLEEYGPGPFTIVKVDLYEISGHHLYEVWLQKDGKPPVNFRGKEVHSGVSWNYLRPVDKPASQENSD